MSRFQQREPVDDWFRIFSEKWEAHYGPADVAPPDREDQAASEKAGQRDRKDVD